MRAETILVVDDEDAIRFSVVEFLGSKGFRVIEAETVERALSLFERHRPDAAILDYRLPDGNALELVETVRERGFQTPLILLTGHGSIELAVKAIQQGADQFLTKPVELPALLALLERVLDHGRARRSQMASQARQERSGIDPFLGSSPAIQRLQREAQRALDSGSPILIRGETGTGKGVLAHWLHRHGPRADEAFIDLNCAGLSREFLQTELFGHSKGAFTGAVQTKRGLVEVAHRGILFLDEIGDMALELQPQLLKVVEEKTYRPLGEVEDREVDVQLIIATNRELRQAVQDGLFRQDLYYRLSTIPLSVPPLRERSEDIEELAGSLLTKLAGELKRSPVSLSEEAVEALRRHAWPGNIRELRNVLERALLHARTDQILPGHLHFDTSGAVAEDDATVDSSLTLEEVERRQIVQVLEEEGGRVASAAERLEVPRSTLYSKIREYGLDLERYKLPRAGGQGAGSEV